jgi:hypothetical protein
MGGASYPMNLNNQNYQKSLAEDLKGVSAALENAVEQLDFIIQGMLTECLCEYPPEKEGCACCN